MTQSSDNIGASRGTATEPEPDAHAETAPIVQLRGGSLRGGTREGVHYFLGVPYGEDTATTRFRRAAPVRAWRGVRNATAYTTQCPQPVFPESPVYAGMEIQLPPSEDCLHLNIWTPACADGGKRPVLVWLHGGGFVMGSGSAHPYDGVRLVKRGDIVLVTITHRLNMFGFLALGDLLGSDYAESGNVGMLDLVLALEWVRDNIASFGGDPSNVTIFGESGGGAKVHSLMAMPSAQGLFHRAAIQSGGGGLAIMPAEAAKQPIALLNALGFGEADAAKLLTLPAQHLTQAFVATFAPSRFPGSRPVIDGKILPRHPFYPDAPELSRDVPLMVGSTRTEATALLGAFFPDLFSLGWDDLPARLQPIMTEWGIYDTVPAIGSRPEEAIIVARQHMPNASPQEVFFQLASYAMFIRGAVRTAELKASQGGAAYLWSLDWATPVDGGKWGAPHALDVPLFFDNVALAPAMLGPDLVVPQQLADAMSDALIAFARTGNPSHSARPWPGYDAVSRETMVFDMTSCVVRDPRGWARKLFSANVEM